MINNEEEYMSDNSVETDELNHNNNDDVYETKEVKGLDRTTTKKITVKKKPAPKSKPIPIPKKPAKKVIKKDLKEELLEEPTNEIIEEEPEPEPDSESERQKKITQKRLENLKKAREAKAVITNKTIKKIKKDIKKEIPEKVVEKTKIIYMIPTNDGFVECDTIPKLTKNQLKKMENEEIVTQQEIEIGKKLIRKKNGSADLRSANTKKKGQTEAQKAATQKMLEANKKRREAKKKEKEETLGKQVKSALIDVVSKPISQVKKEIETPKKEEPKSNQYDFSTVTRFF
tara:strand:+ start:363 stop:1223 length:861 start_codon:yes stop_codon:yes gene_type:complete